MNKPNFASVVINKNKGLPLSRDPLPNMYSPHYLRALEYIYDCEGLISSGGIESIEAMLINVKLDKKTLLDVGCGLGGVDLYLARKHDVTITAVDSEAFMIECARNLLHRTSSPLKGKITFQALSNPISLRDFADNTFDIALSKQVLYHLPADKREEYLREIGRVLKPTGSIVTEDLLVSTWPYTDAVKRALHIDASKETQEEPFCYLLTPEHYSSLFINAGFQNVNFTDNTDAQIRYAEMDIERIQNSAQPFIKELGQDTYDFCVNLWDKFIHMLREREIISGIFSAIKK